MNICHKLITKAPCFAFQKMCGIFFYLGIILAMQNAGATAPADAFENCIPFQPKNETFDDLNNYEDLMEDYSKINIQCIGTGEHGEKQNIIIEFKMLTFSNIFSSRQPH